MTAIKTKHFRPQLFQDVVARAYFALSDGMQAAYGDYNNYLTHYLANTGFSVWLEAMRGHSLEQYFVEHIVRIYMIHGDRKFSEIPSLLVHIARHYDVELPVVEGILTVEFWDDIVYYNLWGLPGTPKVA